MHGVQKNNLYEQLEYVLAMFQLGDVASDHKAELAGFRGWNYVAITAIAKMATRSLIYVYDDKDTQAAQVRKSLRLQHGTNWRKALVREHQGNVLDNRHPLVKLLSRPNPHQSGGSFRWEQIQQLRLHGSCLVFNRPNVLNTHTVERYVVPLSLVTPIRPGTRANMPRGGIIINPSSWNAHAPRDAQMFSALQQFVSCELPAEYLTIIKYPHPFLRGDGASPTTAGSHWIDGSMELDDNRADYYREGTNGKLILTTDETDPEKLEDAERRLEAKLQKDGPTVTILSGAHSILDKKTADDMAYAEGHDHYRDDILAIHGTSRAMVGNQEGMTYGSLAASVLASTMLSVQPDMDLIADEETVSIGSQWGEGICIEYEVPAINDPDLEDKRLAQDASLGVMTVGEYRTKRGEPKFGNRYDSFILTSSGPVDPDTLIKERAPDNEPAIPPAPSFDMPELSFDIGKSLIAESDGTIAIDDTILDSLDRDVVQAFEQAGYNFRSLMDDEDEVEAVWDWSMGTDLEKITKSLKQGPRLQTLLKSLEAAKPRKYACVMFMLPEMYRIACNEDAGIIPDEEIAIGGREMESHVTALYGIVGVELDEIVRVVSRMESPLVTVGPVRHFPDGPDGCPLFVEVNSPAMHQANAKLRELLPHVQKYPEYKPHVTLAYVTDGAKYEGKLCSLSNKSCYLSKAIISMADGTRAVVPLRRPFEPGDIPNSPVELDSVGM